MAHFLIYDNQTGKGVQAVTCALSQMDEYDETEPFIEVNDPVTDPGAWSVVGGEAVFVGRPVTSDQVNAERDRRIADGFVWNGHSFDFDEASKQNITGAGALAGAAIGAGAVVGDLRWHGGSTDFAWITANNQTVTMDAFDVLSMASTAAEHTRHHIFAARALKESAVIPSNYTDDSFWI